VDVPGEKTVTDAQFDERIAAIQTKASELQDRAAAYRDQEMARLFVGCGWTQQRIAKHMDKSQKWVSNRLLFGRYLSFRTSGSKTVFPAENLTERRFRACWPKTKGSERHRFGQVAELLTRKEAEPSSQAESLMAKPGIKKAVAEVCGDGSYRSVRQIAADLDPRFPGITTRQVTGAIQQLQRKSPKGTAVESRHIGRSHHYRIIPKAEINDPASLAESVLPFVREIKSEASKSMAAMSRGLIMEKAEMIERLLSRLLVPAGV
jgi:hypothetical protein